MFNLERPITLEIDTLDRAIGACLSQPDDSGKMYLVVSYSRKFTRLELNYEIYDKELIAIVDAFRE